MVPNKNDLRIDIYVNAHFAGIYTSEDKINPMNVKVGRGYS